MIPVKKIVIVGGGISGLATAYRLCELNRSRAVSLDITVLEAKDRFGGLIQTVRHGDFLVEAGPESFSSAKPHGLALCKRLGLESELLGTCPENRHSSIYSRGRMHRIPEGFYLMAPLRWKALWELSVLSLPGKLRMACEPCIPALKNTADEGVGPFVKRRFGRETLEKIGQPLFGSIYGGDVNRLSLLATFPEFRKMEREHGSIVRALYWKRKQSRKIPEQTASGARYSLFMTLRNGLGGLVTRLVESMPEVCFCSSAAVTAVRLGLSWTLHLANGHLMEADVLCLAMPVPDASRLLKASIPDLAAALDQIPYESISTVSMAFHKKDLPRAMKGFGFVIPEKEGKKISGCTFSSHKFSGRAPEGYVLLRSFLRRMLNQAKDPTGDSQPEKFISDELRSLFRIQSPPRFMTVHEHNPATPYYEVGHLERVARIRERESQFKGLYLTGNAYRGVSIPDCIRQGEETAERIFADHVTKGG